MRKTLLECLLACLFGAAGTTLGLFLRQFAPPEEALSAIAMAVGQVPALIGFLLLKSRFFPRQSDGR
ncbi:hypothetical protein [Devosia riboflavina]